MAPAAIRKGWRTSCRHRVAMGRTEVTPFPDNPWHRIRKAAGIEEVRPNDLRRAVGSWLTQGGVDLNRVKDALRHANIETTSIYAPG